MDLKRYIGWSQRFSQTSPACCYKLATVAVNDLRISLLVSDERFLGIILQELDILPTKHGILTPDQANALQQGIVPTLLSGSPELKQWMERNNQDKASKDKWQDLSIRPGVTSYILQTFVREAKSAMEASW
ncbi:LOW QUALITY PROTEIN: hypothetical protein IFM47457_04992 [Aspergillus lentulus]|nr:LOW QUALITY PROTEIN: hypothetical protein IFM47457_04992 [Aspergillus lentulus]